MGNYVLISNLIQKIKWIDILQETIIITGFVIIIIILIELLNSAVKEKLAKFLDKNPYLQIILGSLFGLIPGCIGTFIIVALYSERVISISTLIAALIASVGDEAFIMLAVMPKESILLFTILAVLAISTGFTTELIKRKINKKRIETIVLKENTSTKANRHNYTENHNHNSFSIKNLNLNFYKIILITFLFIIIGFFITNTIEHNHGTKHDEYITDYEQNNTSFYITHNNDSEASIIKIILIIASSISIILLLFSNNNFVKNHICKHIIIKHLPKIFFWILITLIAINGILLFIDINGWIQNNYFIMLFIAIIIGLIPQSGPHLIFVSLFVEGAIPFSILLANSIVQDGHGGLPLLANDRKVFFLKKLISIVLALIIGVLFWII